MENFNAEEARKLTASFKIIGILERIQSKASEGESFIGVYESLSPLVIADLESKGFTISFPTADMIGVDNKTIQCINW